MSVPIEYHNSATPEPYESAPTPANLSLEDYEALEKEWGAMEERYKEAVTRHDEWKAVKNREAKEAQVEKLRKEKEACLLKVEALKKEKLEAERRAEEEWKAEEKRKEDERVTKELKKKEEAVEHKWLADLKEKEDKKKKKEKEKEDEANEMALQTAGAPSASNRDSKVDPADPKTVTMDELRRRWRITKGKKREHATGFQKRKVQSASLVDDSGVEDENASVGPSTPKRLKTEPVPQAKDKVFTGNGAWYHRYSVLFVHFGFFRVLWQVLC